MHDAKLIDAPFPDKDAADKPLAAIELMRLAFENGNGARTACGASYVLSTATISADQTLSPLLVIRTEQQHRALRQSARRVSSCGI